MALAISYCNPQMILFVISNSWVKFHVDLPYSVSQSKRDIFYFWLLTVATKSLQNNVCFFDPVAYTGILWNKQIRFLLCYEDNTAVFGKVALV